MADSEHVLSGSDPTGRDASEPLSDKWDSTSLGPQAAWPQPLRTLVALIRASMQPMFVVWGETDAFLYNDAYAETLGARHPGAFGQPFPEVWADVYDELGPLVAQVQSGSPVYLPDLSFPVEHGDRAEEVHMAFSWTPVRGQDGGVEGFFCACVDTTAQLAGERRLELALRRLESVFEQAPGFIAAVDGPDHVFSVANAAFRQLVGDGRELVGKSLRDALPEAAEDFVSLLDRVFDTGRPFTAHGSRISLRRGPDGNPEERFVDFVYHPYADDDGKVTGIFCEGVDVTERHRAVEELRRLNETLEQRVADELASREHAEDALRQSQKMEAIGQLTGGVAHDFNNLLTVIRSAADILRRLELDETKRRRYLDAIADTADRAAKLTAQLLAFARRQALHPVVFNAAELVRSIVDMLHTVVGARVHLATELECDDCWVEADAVQFETALVNLAVNARDAMDGEGRLSISVRPRASIPAVRGHSEAEGQFVAVSLTDTGPGIPAHVIHNIFEPFFTTKEVGKGTGLGLSQVYGFAKQSGGEVDVASREGEGACFTLYLPRVAPPAGTVVHTPETEAERTAHGHILIVEDNEDVGAFSTELLSDLGYQTSRAANAEAALRMIEAAPDAYSVVFSDVVMPGRSGIELAREIRDRWPDLPVVLTSGYSHVIAQEGSHGFELLNKPWSLEDLQRVLRTAER